MLFKTPAVTSPSGIFDHIHDGDPEKAEEHQTRLKKFSGTRWSAKFHSFEAFSLSYSAVIDFLVLLEAKDTQASLRDKATELLTKIKKFSFIFILELLYKLFSYTNTLSLLMQ
jgi:hypothetical protein